MISNKYIVKNCPCNVTTEDMCDWENTNETYCQDCTSCVIKQVIEKCNIYKNFIAITISDYAKRELALAILQLFDIEEVEKCQ